MVALKNDPEYHRERGRLERLRQMRFLLLLAVVVLAVSVLRSGADRVFPQGWWRLW